MAKAKTVFFGTIIGAVGGFVAGILTAKKPGKETRQDIKNKALDVKDDAVTNGKYAKLRAEETMEDIQDALDDLKVRARRVTNAAKKELKK